jgi:hypothetical protein
MKKTLLWMLLFIVTTSAFSQTTDITPVPTKSVLAQEPPKKVIDSFFAGDRNPLWNGTGRRAKLFTGTRQEYLAQFDKIFIKQPADSQVMILVKIMPNRKGTDFHPAEIVTTFRQIAEGKRKGQWWPEEGSDEAVVVPTTPINQPELATTPPVLVKNN